MPQKVARSVCRFVLLIVCAMVVTNCRWARKETEASGTRFTVFVTSELHGQLTPCGCSENMLGGLGKIAKVLDEARKGPTPILYVDAGNALFGHDKLPEGALPEQKKKAETVGLALENMNVSAVVAGELDDRYGTEFRSGIKLPWVRRDQMQLLPVGHRLVALISADSAAELSRLAVEARERKADFVLAVAKKGLVLENNNEIKGLDLLILRETNDAMAHEENRLVRSKPTWVQVQSRGRSVLRIDVNPSDDQTPLKLRETSQERARATQALEDRIETLRRQINSPGLITEARLMRQAKLEELTNRRMNQLQTQNDAPLGKFEYSVQFVPIESHLPQSAPIQTLVEQFEREAAQINLAWAQQQAPLCPEAESDMPSFVGSQACQSCHVDAYQTWKATKHASAYKSLVAKKSQFQWQCVGCHVTGFQKPGGVCRIDRVENREHVGCESCHGPGSKHVDSPWSEGAITRGNSSDMCVSCHNVENSPHFEFKTYLPLILGRGHESLENTSTSSP